MPTIKCFGPYSKKLLQRYPYEPRKHILTFSEAIKNSTRPWKYPSLTQTLLYSRYIPYQLRLVPWEAIPSKYYKYADKACSPLKVSITLETPLLDLDGPIHTPTDDLPLLKDPVCRSETITRSIDYLKPHFANAIIKPSDSYQSCNY